METSELIAMIREGAKGCDPGDTMIFPETGKIICVADLLEVADRLEYLTGLVNEWEGAIHGKVEKLVVHAHWIRVGWGYYKCSHCEAEVGVVSGHKNYCANCGARMDEEVAE